MIFNSVKILLIKLFYIYFLFNDRYHMNLKFLQKLDELLLKFGDFQIVIFIFQKSSTEAKHK